MSTAGKRLSVFWRTWDVTRKCPPHLRIPGLIGLEIDMFGLDQNQIIVALTPLWTVVLWPRDSQCLPVTVLVIGRHVSCTGAHSSFKSLISVAVSAETLAALFVHYNEMFITLRHSYVTVLLYTIFNLLWLSWNWDTIPDIREKFIQRRLDAKRPKAWSCAINGMTDL